ncbi:MAG: hypothetical protein HYZ83_02870, partial [Candidatus Omnitrophica bacterium]|nr:hypothetical protein [Candidatus Omnitrophota bacterium]
YVYDGKLYVGGWNALGGSEWQGTYLSTTIEGGGWHHVALTLKAGETISADALKGYLDGAEFGRAAGSQLWEHAALIGIGGMNNATKFHDEAIMDGNGNYLKGGINGVEIYNRKLSGREVGILTRLTAPPDVTPPILTLVSPNQTNVETYIAIVQADGQNLPAQTWQLGRGTHNLIVQATDSAGNTSRTQLSVMRTGVLPEPQNPPAAANGQKLTQTLTNGSVATYMDGKLISITTVDGNQLLSPTFDESNKIASTWLKTLDGIITYLENEILIWSRDSAGNVTWYFSDGKVEAVRSADGQLALYAYQIDDQSNILGILITTEDISTLLDGEGRIIHQLRQDGRWVAYDRTVNPDSTLRLSRPNQPGIDLPLAMIYAGDELREITQTDGTVIRFQKGIPTEIIQPDGAVTSISAQESGQILSGLAVTRGGITRLYGADGKLTQITVKNQDDQSDLKVENEELGAVILSNGDEVSNGVYDENDHLISGVVTKADGSRVEYSAGLPVEAVMKDGNRIKYTNGQASELILPDGRSYSLDRSGNRWVASLILTQSLAPLPEGTLTEMIYFGELENLQLVEATRSDEARLIYKEGRLDTLTHKNGTVISYIYDNQSKLVRTLAVSPDNADPVLRTDYAYDKIREVYKGDVLIYKYSYEFPADEIEITVIEEVDSGLVKRYRQGLLISQTDADGAVTTYEYSDNPAGYSDPYETAIGMIYTLPGGNQAHYERTTNASQPWKLIKITRADGSQLPDGGKQDDKLSDHNGVSSAPGKIGNSAQFIRADQTYLSAPNSVDQNLSNSDFTFSVWVYLNSNSEEQVIFTKGLPTGEGNEYMLVFDPTDPNPQKKRFKLNMNNGGRIYAHALGVPQINTWYFITGGYDSANGQFFLQVNNSGDDHFTTAQNGIQNTNVGLRLGNWNDYPGLAPSALNGRIDELGFWKRVLTAQERTDLYNAGQGNRFDVSRYGFDVDSSGKLSQDLVTYYNFEETSGTRADSANLSSLIEKAVLPADYAGLRRMAEQGTLTPIQPDDLDRSIQTAIGMVQTLPGGNQAHYERTSNPAEPWKLVKITRPDGTLPTSASQGKDPLTDHNGVGAAAGKIGNAAQFITANQTYLSGGDTADLSMGNIDFSMSVWVYLDTLDEDMAVLYKGPGGQGDPEYWLRWEHGRGDRFAFQVTDGTSPGNEVTTSGFPSPQAKAWHHLFVWHDSINNLLGISLDNTYSQTVPYSGGGFNGDFPFEIGRRFPKNSQSENYWNGRIDELGVWKKVLTAQERNDLYNAGNGNTFRNERFAFDVDSNNRLTDGLTAYYNFEETSGTRADSVDFAAFTARVALPASRSSLRQLVEQGALKVVQPADVPASAPSPSSPSPVLIRSTVSYQGKVRETFTYRYEDEKSLVTDAGGVTRTYDMTKRLLAIEHPDGTKYGVTYSRDLSEEQRLALEASRLRTVEYTDLDGIKKTMQISDPNMQPFDDQKGEEITIQHLIRRRLHDGTVLEYAFGQLREVHLPDGKILTNFTADRNGIPIRAILKLPDGTQRNIQNGALVELTQEGEVTLRYREDSLVEIGIPVNALEKVTVSSVGLDAGGHLKSGEVLLPSGDRLFVQGGRFASGRLSDGTEIRSVNVEKDGLTGATLSVSGSNVLLSDTRNVEVTLPSGQKYLYRYKADAEGQPTDELESMTFLDDFEDNNSLDWRTTGGWSVSGGDLRGSEMNFSDSAPSIYAQTGLNWEDYTVTSNFTYEQITGKSSEARVLFRYEDDNNYYLAQTIRRTSDPHKDWHLMLGGRVAGQSFEAVWIPLGGFSEGGQHILNVEVKGSNFRVYLDGSFRGEFSDERLPRGSVGYSVRTAITRFHSLEVKFPGGDLRDSATYEVDRKLRDLRHVVSQANNSLNSLGFLPPSFDPELANSTQLQVLEESTDPEVKAVVAAVRQASADPTLPIVTEMDSQGKLIAVKRIDGSVVTYNSFQKPTAQYDIDGRVQTEYIYDNQGRLLQLFMRGARDGFDEREEVMKREVTRRKSEALRELALQKKILKQEMEANLTVARSSLANIAQSIQDQLELMEKMDVQGKAAKRQKGQALDQLRSGLNTVLDKQMELEEKYAEALVALEGENGEVAIQKAKIEEETNKAFQEIETQKEAFFKEILRQEIRPVADWVYRDILGRDPSMETELKQLVEEAYLRQKDLPASQLPPPVDIAALTQTIKALPEYAFRSTEVQSIKNQVAQKLTEYVQGNPGERQALLDLLGLNISEIIDLKEADVTKILAWLNGQGNHFGHSAFLALKEYLAGQGIQATTVNLAVQTILIDVLAGVINPKTAGDLELSLFSLQRVAKLQGGTGFAAQIDFLDLQSLLASGKPVIAHVNTNHYIVILSIAEDGTITYREPNQGPEGETLTMTQAEFIRIWKGAVLTPRAPPRTYQILSDREAQSIRGSFFLAAIIFLIIAFREQIAKFLHSVAIWINDYLPSFISPIKSTLVALFAGFGNLLQGNFKEALMQLGTVALTVAMAIVNPLAFVISTTISTALTALGANPTITALVSAFVSGGVAGGLGAAANAAFTFSQAVGHGIVSGLQAMAVTAAELGSIHMGLNPALAGLAGIGVNAIAGSLLHGTDAPIKDINGDIVLDANGLPMMQHLFGFEALSHTLSTQLLPTFVKELGIYGIAKLGESIGLDPRITSLVGGAFQNIVSNVSRGIKFSEIIHEVKKEILRDGTRIGIQMIGEEIGLSPLLAALSSRALTSSIAAGLNAHTNIIEELGKAFWVATTKFVNFLQAQLSTPEKIIEFSYLLKNHSLEEVLEQEMTTILEREAVESVVGDGGIVSILTRQTKFIELNGVFVKEVTINDKTTLYFHAVSNDLIGRRNGNHTEWGLFVRGIDQKFHLWRGTSTVDFEFARTHVSFENGRPKGAAVDWLVKDEERQLLIHPTPDTSSLDFNEDGTTIKEGMIENTFTGVKVVIHDGVMRELIVPTSAGYSHDILANIDVSNIPPQELFKLIEYGVGNGVGNGEEEGNLPQNIDKFRDDLAREIDPRFVMPLPLYETGNFITDSLSWILDAMGTNIITNEVRYKLDAEIMARGSLPPTRLVYSGNFQPLLRAIEKEGYEIDTLVVIGGPTVMDDRIPDQIKRIVYVVGEQDNVPGVDRIPNFRHRNDSAGQSGVETILVRMANSAGAVKHTDYFQWPGDTNPYHAISHNFLLELTKASPLGSDPRNLFNALGLQPVNGIYRVDVGDLEFQNVLNNFRE